jgi:1-acyl-sn-glycerol-3-phosphate acyltransferase
MSASPASAGEVARSLVYLVWLYGLMLVMGLLGSPLLLGPRRGVLWAIALWSRLALWGLRWIVGLKVEVRGLEHRPAGAGLVAAKHQGMLDTIAPFAVLPDPCFVLKRELMRLPVFGWYAGRSGMIPVHRGGGSSAVRALNAAARDRLQHARQIVIFPEGTRREPGAPPAYKSGVAALYRDLGFACTPMATNSGLFWPAHGFVRRPGVAVFEFLEPIPPGLKRAEFMRLLEERIEAASDRLLAEGRAGG